MRGMQRGAWAIWVGGAVLAAVLILVGPAGLGAAIGTALDRLRAGLSRLSPMSVSVLRALTIALAVVFVALCGLASRRGLQVGRALFWVALVLVLLVAFPGDTGDAGWRWAGACLLCLVAALTMTARVQSAARPPGWRG